MDTDACLEDFLLPTPPKRRGTPVFLGFVASFWPSVVQVIAIIAVEVMMFVASFKSFPGFDRANSLVVLHASLWGLVTIIGWFNSFVHRRSRLRGYFNFYRQSQLVRKAPFYVLSFGNSALLLIWALTGAATNTELPDVKTRILSLKILYSCELAICLPITIVYIKQVANFNWEIVVGNRLELTQKVTRLLELIQTCIVSCWLVLNQVVYFNFVQRGSGEDTNGFTEELDDVLEKQADIIRFMKQHNESLSRRIRTLTERLDEYERGAEG